MVAGKPTENEMKLKIKAKLENLTVIDEFITDSLRQLGVQDKVILQVQLALDEACTNIIQHAYSGVEGGIIIINCIMSGNDLVIEIKDWGKIFDPTSVPQPDTKSGLFERKEGGMGIFLMKRMMDDVKYILHPGSYNELRMIKHIPQGK